MVAKAAVAAMRPTKERAAGDERGKGDNKTSEKGRAKAGPRRVARLRGLPGECMQSRGTATKKKPVVRECY